MSNHSGSYMLNNVLELCRENGILDALTKEARMKFFSDIVKLGCGYDCNEGEILEGIGEDYKICYLCLEEKDELENGICKECLE